MLFRERKAWTTKVTENSHELVELTQRLDSESAIIQRSAAIAVENIKQHVGNLRPKFDDCRTWADGILKDQSFWLENWQPILEKVSGIKVHEEVAFCLSGLYIDQAGIRSKSNAKQAITLRDLMQPFSFIHAAEDGSDIHSRFKESISTFTHAFEALVHDSEDVVENFSKGVNLSDSDAGEQAGRLMEEVEIIARKVSTDYEHVIGLPNSQKSITQTAKIAMLQARNLLPSLLQINAEASQLLKKTAERKNELILSSVADMRKIAVLESTVGQLHAQLASLDSEISYRESFDILGYLFRLPIVYGSLLVECVRRREWNEKMTMDSSSLVEEIATFKEEELRRRGKWAKEMEDSVDLGLIDDMSLGIDINIQAQKQKWPGVSRQDITSFLRQLQDSFLFQDVHREIAGLARSLDAPTRHQAKRAKAFKNGSIHDVAFGRNSLLLRGDDELLQLLKNEKSKLEDRLKSSDSRIRKLEDLLHRQTQISRPSSGHAPSSINGPIFERHAISPTLNYTSALSRPVEIPSRRSSFSSRRLSVNADLEERNLAQRVVSLEAELDAEKIQVANLQKDAAIRTQAEDDLKGGMQEAISTKKDLMENLEAQQREFDDERRLLKGENTKIRIRLEEVEDELDKVIVTRQEEDKVHSLKEELERVRKHFVDEAEEAQKQIEILRSNYSIQSERANKLAVQVQEQNSQIAELTANNNDFATRLIRHDQAEAEYHKDLQTALLHLSKDDNAPEEFRSLVDLVVAGVKKSVANIDQARETYEKAQAERHTIEGLLRNRDDKIHALTERLAAEEIEVFSVRESLVEQENQLSSRQAELDNERQQHNELQIRFAKVKADLELSQTKVIGDQKEIFASSGKIDQLQKTVNTLEGDLKTQKSVFEDLQKSHRHLEELTISRATRAVEMSKHSNFMRSILIDLLEHVGLAISIEDNVLLIQRASKSASASSVLQDPAASINRGSADSIPLKVSFETLANDRIIIWAENNDPTLETNLFSQYIDEIRRFDLNVFCEAIIKRVKDSEHIARRWQRETRAYRDKLHRALGEAHDKIAYRSFKEGDLALFLPTRNQATRPWAAFNVGAPHYFLREQDSHKLRSRDWLLARITKVEERLVDLSKSLNNPASDRTSIGGTSDGGTSVDDENPFELSDGLRWYLLDAAEEKPGAPINIGLSKVTVASANVDAKGSIRMKKSLDGSGATKTLTRSLDSRRNSSNSKKGFMNIVNNTPPLAPGPNEPPQAETRQEQIQPEAPPRSSEHDADSPIAQDPDAVRKDLLWGP